jgi:ABC-type multidrug transport system, ATPase component
LFLDEPTTGLDPNTRRTIWNIINGIREQRNMTVFLTTHYMEEAEKANRVVIIDSGKIIADGTPNELKNRFSGDYVKLYSERSNKLDEILDKEHYTYKYDNKAYVVRVNNSKEAYDFLTANPEIVKDFEVIKGDMDDVFLNATGKKLEA